ncbi:hypothetical protein EUGRSUZ_D02112 [Eucalyptus grandis]|uniref:Uncharacterized protein n=2 Tax=Eucalyptus grandis TaxID=71139 RepID=A0ACC3L7M9_EUCGR|nr:hypothetical protein EUGRSUZ_D02112 [Eucalyptus grandis]
MIINRLETAKSPFVVNPKTPSSVLTLQGLVSASSNQGGLIGEISIFAILQALQFCFQLLNLLQVIKQKSSYSTTSDQFAIF